MSEHYPRIRIKFDPVGVMLRDAITLCFFMRHSHADIAQSVVRALDTFVQRCGPSSLVHYVDLEGYWQELDDAGWGHVRQELTSGPYARVALKSRHGIGDYRFEYSGTSLTHKRFFDRPGRACVAAFWMPTEFMEDHGPGSIRELALDLAAILPITSGYAGLSFNTMPEHIGIDDLLRERCFRYPGMDVPDTFISRDIGNRVRGPSWLTFLSQPVLGELGGAEGLRSRLTSTGTTVQTLAGDRAIITLGEWPEAGDLEAGKDLPAYRELARVLEPWTFFYGNKNSIVFPAEDQLRWERRFLD